MVKVHFHGAAGGVTGSCFRFETGQGAFLVDCGMFQGSKTEKELNYRDFPFDPRELAAVVLSHAHIDHSGLLPKLVRQGFKGAIHATPATADLCGVMLPDSAYIQEIEVEQLNRRNAHRHRPPLQPIYTAADVAACLKLFRPAPYCDWFTPLPGVRARFWNAGHMLGSASVEIELAEPGGDRPLRLLVSADLGPDFKLLQPDPQAPAGLDHVICESTYGDTDRPDASPETRRALLRDEVLAAMHGNGALLIPSFAVERAQELITDLTLLAARKELPRIPVYVDSPLAARATQVFARHARDLEGGRLLTEALASHHLRFTETVEQSRALDRVQGFHIVIAASGMCEAGRIRHRLKNWIWRDEATVLLTGYQAEGTLGRILLDGAPAVRIQGEEFAVRARIRSLDLYSGHADGPELAQWLRERMPIAQNVFLVHGEPRALAGLAARLDGIVAPERVVIPALDDGAELTLAGARMLAPAAPPRLERDQTARLDWHNDAAQLILDIHAALDAAADEKARAVILRRLRRGLEGEG
ncbi:MBL fold metallo-hydrolase [Ruixingdingia sedimenti]|uniref:MBL fold metallo-hydrolase n=1 Tax=Ruixingdingia sedimenti TaxID=3073604 RepID=A0ABU1FBS2_9RHOB|nr:MBL fold metallo-hydrolase [Xinfangfangia sp. LG-4]MDR5653837.1 MBL fold metallo-hydrolase [Xinfangfangia sp. LG-4]